MKLFSIDNIFRVSIIICLIGVVMLLFSMRNIENRLLNTKKQSVPIHNVPTNSAELDTDITDISPHIEVKKNIESNAGTRLSTIAKLIILEQDREGKRYEPYLDGSNIVTIGIGRSLQTNGISTNELYAIVKNPNPEYLFNNTHVRNGRFYISSLSVAKQIFTQPLTEHDVQLLLMDDLKNVTKEAKSVFGAQWEQISEPRREAIIDTLFNLGLPHFKQFHEFINAVKSQDWEKASLELIRSEAASKNYARYSRNSAVIHTGNASYFNIGN